MDETITPANVDTVMRSRLAEVGQRAADAILRGDTPDPRDLVELAKIYNLVGEYLNTYVRWVQSDMDNMREEREEEDRRISIWKVDKQVANIRVVVPVSQRIYDDLVFMAGLHEDAKELDPDMGAAFIALGLLHKETITMHLPPNPQRPTMA